MASPLRFLNGISSVASTDPLEALPYLDPTTWAIWMDDFILAPATSLGWTLTNTNGTLTQTSTGGAGQAVLTLGGADNDLAQMYLTTATFALTSGKKMICESKIKVDKGAAGTIGEQELFIGLASLLTGGNFTAADGLTMTVDNCVGFWSPDGSTGLNPIARVADVESIQTGVGVYADATYYVVTWYFNGTSIYYYIGGTLTGTLAAFPTGAVTPTLYIKAGEAKAAVLSSGYVLVAVER